MHSESEFYAGYKKIRNKLRQYDGVMTVVETINYLREKTRNPVEEMSKMPWLCTLLIKWAALDVEFCLKKKSFIQRHKLIELLQSMHDLSAKLMPLVEYDHFTFFLRNFAFQQFWYQREPNVYSVARQSILFANLEDTHSLKKTYREKYNLEIEESLYLSLPLFIILIHETRPIVRPNDYGDMTPLYGDKIVQYLNNISLDRDNLHDYLFKWMNSGRGTEEYFEQTPLVSYPLFRYQDYYMSYSKQVVARSLEAHCYDTLRRTDPSWFMNKFGKVFERYVERGLQYSGANYITEKELQRIIGNTEKCIDFYIADGDVGVMIDAKGVELSHNGKSAHLANIVKGATKNTILKAIEQASNLVSIIEKRTFSDEALQCRGKYYLLVVTYKEMYLGNGEFYYQRIAREELDRLEEQYQCRDVFPYEHVFFMTIEEYEMLVAMVREGFRLDDILEKVAEAERVPENKKYEFHQHLLQQAGVFMVPEYLKIEMNRIWDELGTAMKRGSL
jgi:hypothetical protein